MTKTTTVTEEEILVTLERAIKTGKLKNPHAISYFNAFWMCQTQHEFAVQVLYVLSNLQSWRGEEAREAKKVMKQYVYEVEGYRV